MAFKAVLTGVVKLNAVLSSGAIAAYVKPSASITYRNAHAADLFLDAHSLNRRFADSYSFVDTISLDVGTSFSDSYSLIDIPSIRTSTDKTSDLGLSDEQIITIFYSRSFDEQASLISNTVLLQGKVFGDTQFISDDFSKTVTYFRDLASAFTLDDFLTAGVEDLKKHTEGDKGNIFGFDSVLDYDLSTSLQTVQTLVSTPAVLFSTGFSSNSSVTDAQVKSFGKNVSLNPFIFAQRSPAEIADSLAYNYMLSDGAVTAPTKYSFLFNMSASDFSNQIFPYISADKRDAATYQLNYVDRLLDPNGPNSNSNLNYERTTFIADLFAGDYDGDFVGLSDLLETVDVSKRVIDERIDFSDRSFLDGRTPAEYADWTGFLRSVKVGDTSANDYVLGLLNIDSISDISSGYEHAQLLFIASQLTEEEMAEHTALTQVLAGGTDLLGNPHLTISKNFTRTNFVTGLLGVGPNLIDETAFDYTTGFSSTGQLISTPSIGAGIPATSSYSITDSSFTTFGKNVDLTPVDGLDLPSRSPQELADIMRYQTVTGPLSGGQVPEPYHSLFDTYDAEYGSQVGKVNSADGLATYNYAINNLNTDDLAAFTAAAGGSDYATTFVQDVLAGDYDDQFVLGPLDLSLTDIIDTIDTVKRPDTVVSTSDVAAIDYTTGFSATSELISTPSIGVSFPATSSYSVTSDSRSHFDKRPGDILSAVHPFDAPVRTVNELADILSVKERLDAGAISIPTKYRGMWPIGDESVSDWSQSIQAGASVSWTAVLSEFVDRLNSSTNATIDYQSTTFIDDLFAGKYDTAGFIDFEDSDVKQVSKNLTEIIATVDETSFLADKPFTSSYSFDDVFSHSSSSDKTDSFSFTDTEALSVFKHLHSSYSLVSDVSSVRGQTRYFEGGSESTSVTDLVSKSVPKSFDDDNVAVSDNNIKTFQNNPIVMQDLDLTSRSTAEIADIMAFISSSSNGGQRQNPPMPDRYSHLFEGFESNDVQTLAGYGNPSPERTASQNMYVQNIYQELSYQGTFIQDVFSGAYDYDVATLTDTQTRDVSLTIDPGYRFNDAMWSSLTGESAADVYTYLRNGDHTNLDDKYVQLFDFNTSGSITFFDTTGWIASVVDENLLAAVGMFNILNADDYDDTNYSRTTFIADILDGDYDDQLETGDPIFFLSNDIYSLTKLISSSYSFSSDITLQNLRAASSAASMSDETSLESALPVDNSYSVSDASINHVTKIATSPPLPATKVSLSSTDWRDYAALNKQWARENTGSLDQSIFYQRSPAELADSLAFNLMLDANAVTVPSAYSPLFDMSASDFSGRIFPYISTDKRDAAIYQLNYVDRLLDPDGPNSNSNRNYERTTFIADLFDGDYDGGVRLPEIYRNLININNNYYSDGTPRFDAADLVAINTAATNNLSQANYDLFSASANGTDTTDYTHTHIIPDILTGAYDIPESQAFMSDEIQIDLQTTTASSTPNQSAFNASTFN